MNNRELQEDAFQKLNTNYGGIATRQGQTQGELTKTSLNIKGIDDEIVKLNNGKIPNVNVILPNKGNILNQNIIFESETSDSVKGNIEESKLSYNFLSSINKNVIQDTIRYEIYSKRNKIISKQSDNELFIILRSILLQYGDMSLTNTNDIINEIKKLNKIVVDYCVNNIISTLDLHVKYIDDISHLPVPLENPHYAGKVDMSFGHPYL